MGEFLNDLVMTIHGDSDGRVPMSPRRREISRLNQCFAYIDSNITVAKKRMTQMQKCKLGSYALLNESS